MKEKFDYETAEINLDLARAFAWDAALRTPDTETPQEAWDAFCAPEPVAEQVIELPKLYLDGFGILTDQDSGLKPGLAL